MILFKVVSIFLFLGILTINPSPTLAVDITINNNIQHQMMEGFGATNVSLVYDGALGDVLSPALRTGIIDAAYKQVGLTTGNLDVPLLESTGGWSGRQNDNVDPFTINALGFDSVASRNSKTKLVDIAEPLGFNNYYLAKMVNNRFASPWMVTIRTSNYNLYLDEAAEQILATALHWRDQYGIIPTYIAPFNEPTSGNNELNGGTTQEVVDIIKRAGSRLQTAGFSNVKFVVPNEETTTRSHTVAQAILSDPVARQYVGAIGYHPYPYGGNYSFIPNILSQSGSGNPNQAEITSRTALKQLGQQYGVPVWMTEVSHGTDGTTMDIRSFDTMRGRAIHIHDELEYANASAFFGMHNIWDRTSEREHFGGDVNLYKQEGHIAIADQNNNQVYITGMGYAIGHFARWITKGAIRLEAVSPDSLVQVSAFRDNTKQRLITVIINNASVQKSIALKLTGLSISGNSSGEQSTAAVFWNPLSAISSTSLTTNYLIPALSVTTISSPFENSTTPTPPATLTTTPSPTPTSQPLTPGDTNGDRAINLTDLTIVLTNFGKSGVSIGRAQGDLDGSHSVTLSDLTIILANFGKTS